VASFALVMDLLLIWQAVSIKTNQPQIILEVPPHMYLSDTMILVGEDKKA
jgi:hypothetical protein